MIREFRTNETFRRHVLNLLGPPFEEAFVGEQLKEVDVQCPSPPHPSLDYNHGPSNCYAPRQFRYNTTSQHYELDYRSNGCFVNVGIPQTRTYASGRQSVLAAIYDGGDVGLLTPDYCPLENLLQMA